MSTKSELYSQMQAILDTAKAESRGLSSAEKGRFDLLEGEFDQIVRAAGGTGAGFETRGAGGGFEDPAHRQAFDNYLRYGEITSELRFNPLSTAPGAPAAGSSTAGEGGYFVPQGLWRRIAVALKAYGGLANSFQLVETDTGNPMPWPAIDPTGIVGSLVTENTQLTEVDFTIGQGMLSAWTVSSGVHLVSVQVAQDSAFDLDAFIGDRIGEAVGRKLAALAYSGTGSSQHIGVQTAITAKGAASGASGGYITLGTGTTVKKFDGSTPTEIAGNILSPSTVLNLIAAVDPAYWPSSAFFMNSTQALNMRSVSDANDRPLLDFANGFDADDVTNPNYNNASPVARLLGFPVIVDNSISNLTASTNSGPVFGSLQHAMVNRVVMQNGSGLRTMRLTERYADYLQVGYVGYMRSDFRSNDLRAVSGILCASS